VNVKRVYRLYVEDGLMLRRKRREWLARLAAEEEKFAPFLRVVRVESHGTE
jgi:hypothetical protein